MTVTIAGTTGTTQPTATCTTSLVLTGSGSGTTTVQAAATASGTITVPAGTGTIAVNGVSSNLVVGTPVSVVNGSTSTTVTGIPSWAKRVIVTGQGLTKTGGTTDITIQLGTSGGIATTGYVSVGFFSSYYDYITSGFTFNACINAAVYGNGVQSIVATFTLNNASTNQWVGTGNSLDITNTKASTGSGYVSLSGALSQIRIISSTPTDTFSAGTVNVSWE